MNKSLFFLIVLCIILLGVFFRKSLRSSAPVYTNLEDWIRREAIPFSVGSSETFNSAVDKVIASLGDPVELLGFGEALHGGEDILMLRNRLFQRLVEKHGYSAIAVESSFPRSRAVNEYIAGHGPASYEAVQDTGFSHGFGRLDANRELVEWMRQYNAETSHCVKLRFYGFDSPTEMVGSDSPRQLLYFVLDYLDSVDSGGEIYRQRIDLLLGPDDDWENPAASFDPAKSVGLSPSATKLRIETEDLITKLQIRRPELVAKSGESNYLEAVHYTVMARQLLNYHAALASGKRVAELLGIRDAIMADNLAYMVSRERGRGKVLAFAHNSHLKCGQAQWQLGPELLAWWPAGALLNGIFGPRYAVIGSGLGISDANGIGPPEAGTLEARLTALPGPVLFIPTHKGEGLPASEITVLPTRSGSMKNPTYFALTPQSFTDFDCLAVLDSTAYNRGGQPLQDWAAGSEQKTP
ncbi:MAG: erythromycin esterase family protein [bacterium]